MPEKKRNAGGKVEWEPAGGYPVDKVVKKLTSPTKIKGHAVKASKDNPEYIVRSGTSRKEAAHKLGALKKRSRFACARLA